MQLVQLCHCQTEGGCVIRRQLGILASWLCRQILQLQRPARGVGFSNHIEAYLGISRHIMVLIQYIKIYQMMFNAGCRCLLHFVGRLDGWMSAATVLCCQAAPDNLVAHCVWAASCGAWLQQLPPWRLCVSLASQPQLGHNHDALIGRCDML